MISKSTHKAGLVSTVDWDLKGAVAMPENGAYTSPLLNETYARICDRLTERSATLFLGAGINSGVVARNDSSLRMPLGRDLASLISRDLLNEPTLELPLDEVAEIGRHRLGQKEVNRYLYELFTRF